MSPEHLYGLAAVIMALGTLLVAFKGLKATKEVHELVNQKSTDAQIFQAELVEKLNSAGVEVPVDKSLTPAPEEK